MCCSLIVPLFQWERRQKTLRHLAYRVSEGLLRHLRSLSLSIEEVKCHLPRDRSRLHLRLSMTQSLLKKAHLGDL